MIIFGLHRKGTCQHMVRGDNYYLKYNSNSKSRLMWRIFNHHHLATIIQFTVSKWSGCQLNITQLRWQPDHFETLVTSSTTTTSETHSRL